MEESPNDSAISRLLIKNQILSREVKRLEQENARFEKYVVNSITSSRECEDVYQKLRQIDELCYRSRLSINQLPQVLQCEYQCLIKKQDEIEKEITKILSLLKERPIDRDDVLQIQNNFQQLNLNDI